jgi:hypothetical protein
VAATFSALRNSVLALEGAPAPARFALLLRFEGGQAVELLPGVALDPGLLRVLALLARVEEEDLAGELSLVLLEVLLGLEVHPHHLAADRAVRPRGPRLGNGREGDLPGRHQAHGGLAERPSPAEGVRLQVGIGEPPLLQLVARPLVRLLELGRAGDPGADAVGQMGDGLHHLGMVKPLVADAGDHLEVDRPLRPHGREGGEEEQREDGDELAHHVHSFGAKSFRSGSLTDGAPSRAC